MCLSQVNTSETIETVLLLGGEADFFYEKYILCIWSSIVTNKMCTVVWKI